MGKKKLAYFHMGFAVLLIVVVLILLQGSLRDSTRITLPEMPADSTGSDGSGAEDGGKAITITPATVQAAIGTLARPVSYQRQQVVETFWSGGSGKSVSQISVSGALTRIDTTLADSSICHMLIDDKRAAVWYDEETTWTILQRDSLTADIAQRMLTYESVLEVPASRIREADYREYEGVRCIYVAAEGEKAGYIDRFWVSVSSGLLLAAERSYEESLIYRFTAAEPATDEPEGTLFLLPDGSSMDT